MTACMIGIPGVCLGPGTNRHHRKLRSQGGTDDPSNVIEAVCGSGTTGCHGWIHDHPATSYANGWLVKSWDDPEFVPIIPVSPPARQCTTPEAPVVQLATEGDATCTDGVLAGGGDI